jgi:two-component system NtrC family sensor kinase
MAWMGWLIALIAAAAAAFFFVRLREARATNARLSDEHSETLLEMDQVRASRAALIPSGELGAVGQLAVARASQADAPLRSAREQLTAIGDQLDQYRKLVKDYDAAVQYCLQPVEMIFGADKAGIDQLVKHVEEARRRLFQARANLEKSPIINDSKQQLVEAQAGLQHSGELVSGLAKLARGTVHSGTTFDIREVINAVLVLLEPNWQGRITIEREFSETPELTGDPAQLGRIVMHIANNAGQAIKGEGRLIVRTRTVGARHVEISFSDTGEGVPEDQLAAIFEPFYSTRENAAGLGLSTAREIAAATGGTIVARRADAGGLTVLVTLPIEGSSATLPRR